MPDLKRFRPLLKIQAFIDLRRAKKGKLTPELNVKRVAVIRDWWRLVMWYIRLRKAAKGKYTPEELIKVHERI